MNTSHYHQLYRSVFHLTSFILDCGLHDVLTLKNLVLMLIYNEGSKTYYNENFSILLLLKQCKNIKCNKTVITNVLITAT